MIPLSFPAGTKIAVMGLGRSGTATARALVRAGVDLLAWDDDSATRRAAESAGFRVVDPLVEGVAGLAMIVWSPGIPHTHPRPHPLAEAARAAGVPLVCDIELLACARPNDTFIAVTGTNGKSTTTTLMAHVLAKAGFKSTAGGNLGTAALDLPVLPAGGCTVLELSSYQLELTESLRVEAAILLNITPDHLGRHGGMEGYVAAKRHLFDQVAPDGASIVGVDDDPCRAIAAELIAAGRRVVTISAERPLAQGVACDDGILREDGREIGDLRGLARLPGRHNWQNACAVYAAARSLGIEAPAILAAFATYPGLAHRQELVAEINGVRWINDSKATNADAAEKALVCYDRVIWIAGGRPKEGGIASLAPLFPRIVHALLIGEATEAFARTLAGQVPFTCCGELGVAVDLAHRLAEPGTVVLLSPACASWDQFRSFEHRGEVFREMVTALAEGPSP